jgi:serine/threonine-protein kinase
VAKLVLKNAARDALDLDDLCTRLLPHIGSEAGRAQFQGSVRQIRNRHGLSTTGTMGGRSQSGQFGQPTQLTGMPTLLQLSPALMEAAEQKLAAHVGPIAKVLVKRASRMTGNAGEFYRLLADNLPDPQDRARFLREMTN